MLLFSFLITYCFILTYQINHQEGTLPQTPPNLKHWSHSTPSPKPIALHPKTDRTSKTHPHKTDRPQKPIAPQKLIALPTSNRSPSQNRSPSTPPTKTIALQPHRKAIALRRLQTTRTIALQPHRKAIALHPTDKTDRLFQPPQPQKPIALMK
jgi:hypothetical protein